MMGDNREKITAAVSDMLSGVEREAYERGWRDAMAAMKRAADQLPPSDTATAAKPRGERFRR